MLRIADANAHGQRQQVSRPGLKQYLKFEKRGAIFTAHEGVDPPERAVAMPCLWAMFEPVGLGIERCSINEGRIAAKLVHHDSTRLERNQTLNGLGFANGGRARHRDELCQNHDLRGFLKTLYELSESLSQ
jgi:hypothetical protein